MRKLFELKKSGFIGKLEAEVYFAIYFLILKVSYGRLLHGLLVAEYGPLAVALGPLARPSRNSRHRSSLNLT